jgi:hypothetical protein
VIGALSSLTNTQLLAVALGATFVLFLVSEWWGRMRAHGRVFGLGILVVGAAAVATTGSPDLGTILEKATGGGTVAASAHQPADGGKAQGKTAGARTNRDKVTSGSGATAPPTSLSGSILNDAGYARLRAGDYRGARPLLEEAVRRLRGSGSIVYAYALYNLAATRFALGDCDGVLAMLDRSQARQGQHPAIDRLREQAREPCGAARRDARRTG